jgi:hypothetical protein
VLMSQRGRPTVEPFRPPLELIRSPRGSVRRAQSYPLRPPAGPFQNLVARGRVDSLEAAVETTHVFKPKWIETRWKIARKLPGRYSVDLLFPTWGRKSAQVEAVLFDGRRVLLAGPLLRARRLRLRKVAYFYLAGKESGYVMVPIGGRKRGVGRIVRPAPQAAAPEAGPTLTIELAHRRKFKRLEFAARIAPAVSPDHADRVAARLRGR